MNSIAPFQTQEMALPYVDSVRKLFAFEDVLKQLPTTELAVEHFHIPGVYVRKCFLPAGFCVTSRVHKFDNITLVIMGSCLVYQNGERWVMSAGDVFQTKAGTKRALWMPEDCIWATVHNNPEALTNPDEILNFLATNDLEEAITLLEQI
jgi:hypothetical protein